MNKKNFLVPAVCLGLTIVFFMAISIYVNWGYILTISVNPPDAQIYLDNNEIFLKTLSLKRGDYEISFKKTGYAEKKISVNIPKQKNVEVTLEEKPKISFNTQGFLSVGLTETKMGLLGIDKTTGNLMEYRDGANPNIVYIGSVRRWSNNYPWIVILDEKTKTIATILNLIDNTKFNVISPSGKNIEAATISDDGNTAFLLTNNNPITRKSDLVKINIPTKSNTVMLQSDATTLDFLQNNQILLVAEADGEFASTCRVINIDDSQQIMSWKANYCVVNNNKDSVLIASQSSIIYDTTSQEPVDLGIGGDVAWSNNLAVVVTRTNSGVIVYMYENNVAKKTITLPIANYQKLIGATDKHLTLRLLDGQISSYLLR